MLGSESAASISNVHGETKSLLSKDNIGEQSRKMLEKLIPLIQCCKDQASKAKVEAESSKSVYYKISRRAWEVRFA